jgi:hypothetical protein
MVRVNRLPGHDQDVRVAIDSQRGDFFVADYPAGHHHPIDPAQIYIAGDAEDATKIVIGADIILKNAPVPYPIVLARLGARVYGNENYRLRGMADPLYLREPEVTVSKKSF